MRCPVYGAHGGLRAASGRLCDHARMDGRAGWFRCTGLVRAAETGRRDGAFGGAVAVGAVPNFEFVGGWAVARWPWRRSESRRGVNVIGEDQIPLIKKFE